ncbi:hypothetical protein CEXT_706451 [Caerostris extrusa]|uniref:Uncharacterized protein n=1 Tax=Caerostris extrusa TaxID=172846 RepID=A0AAV4S741_CAEEX|nr:hypothetical protein CEXT_706451 [Caerostris extrusa]
MIFKTFLSFFFKKNLKLTPLTHQAPEPKLGLATLLVASTLSNPFVPLPPIHIGRHPFLFLILSQPSPLPIPALRHPLAPSNREDLPSSR